MRKLLINLLFSLTLFSSAIGQRILEVVNEPFDFFGSSIPLNGQLLLARHRGEFLLKYNDLTLSRHNYPIVGGTRLQYSRARPLIVFRSSAYIILEGGRERYLYAYNGGTLTRVVIPGSIASNPVTFGDNLYILSLSGSLVKLYRYDGRTATEVPFAFMPTGGFYELRVENNRIYMIGVRIPGLIQSILKRFDGINTYTFPTFEFPFGIKKIIPIGETDRAYFVLDWEIFYFNGSTVVSIFRDPGSVNISAVLWRDNLYFTSNHGSFSPFPPAVLHEAGGTAVIRIPLPTDAIIPRSSNLLVYGDNLLLQIIDYVGGNRVLSYDGSSFTDFFPLPTRFVDGELFIRDGKLIIHPHDGIGDVAYEYDGATFTSIEGPSGHILRDYLGATICNHLWLMDYVELADDGSVLSLVSLVKESKSCPEPPRPPVLVIPRFFLEFNSFSNTYRARDDRECWSDIIVDWEIDPICPVPEICPRPSFQLTLSDVQDKIVWQQDFDKPINASVQLDGKLPFKTTLSSTDQVLNDLILMDQDLVPKGITGLGLRMQPKEGRFQLAVFTKPGMIVPVKVSLLNKEGKSIWEKEFKAPFTEIIKDKVAEPGEKLHFSVVASQEEINTKIENSTSFTYLNPSHGAVSINVKGKEENVDAELMITTILGQKLVSKRIKTPANIRVELPQYKAGLYVIIIQTKDGRKTNKIVWLK